jgi:hypothetical protein
MAALIRASQGSFSSRPFNKVLIELRKSCFLVFPFGFVSEKLKSRPDPKERSQPWSKADRDPSRDCLSPGD